MPLTHFDLKNAKPRSAPYKLFDGGGLYLGVQPNGRMFWRYKYRFQGVERSLAFGEYPLFSLAEARVRRDETKKLIEAGKDPAVEKKLERLAAAAAARNTFGLIAEEYVQNLAASGMAETTVEKNRWLLKEVAAPIADRPISEITPAELLDLLKRVEKSGRRETAKRLRATMGAVYRLAIVTLRATHDPTAPLKGALLRPNVKHRAAITGEKEFGGLLRALDEVKGWPTIIAALKFLALTCTRPGEVRLAQRDEIDFEKLTWRVPADRTKMRRPHEVPLSRQALELLHDIWPLAEGGDLIFPSIRSRNRPLSDNTMNVMLRRMGYGKDEVTAHGFRSTASTILNERGYNPDVIEAVLGHQNPNAVRRAYNRASYWPERVKLMQEWADMLDTFRKL